MSPDQSPPVPSNHTPGGGVVVGSQRAPRKLLIFEDPQCPFCRQFEEVCGDLLRGAVAAETVVIEYRMRCFLGVESVRADNALALAAEQGQFDPLRRGLFAAQPPEQSGGFTVADLTAAGRLVGLVGPDYESGLRQGRYEPWVIAMDREFQEQDPRGTPAARLDGEEIDPDILFDPTSLGALLRG
jgi:hypothetical protein